MAQTGLEAYLDRAITAFDVGCLKSKVDYWVKSEEILGFDPSATLYVDDDEAALLSAETHGIRHLYHRAKSSSAAPPQASSKRSEEHTSELQSPCNLVCRLLLEK